MALAGEPAVNQGLVAIGADGQPSDNLHEVTDQAQLKPLAAGSVVGISVMRGSAGWGPANGDPLTCLAQAVYFEARSEGEDGQKAVAQVVMNRTHMPQYASTVCGVVYQGWERATGCQFTFVCDGSLRDPSDPVAWGRALDVARNALAGYVYTPMLTATHYHAAWMTPYWAGELTRIRQIGGQIFYH